MGTGQWLTAGTVWLALTLYVAGEFAKLLGKRGVGLGRWLCTLGCAAFLAHVVCAFQYYHGWSHAVAYAETARQTQQLAGWNWGGGLYVNYLFGILWVGEIVWAWANPTGYHSRAAWISWGVRSFFLFMIVNGAFVFVQGARRWVGLLLCVVVVGCWARSRCAPATND